MIGTGYFCSLLKVVHVNRTKQANVYASRYTFDFCRRTADVRSVGYSELFVLSREDVLAALKDHPDAEVSKLYSCQ